MNLPKHIFALSALLFAASATSVFAAINDWENDTSDDNFSSAAQQERSSSQQPSSDYVGWKFSTNLFYALSTDEYIDGVSDTKLDIYGLSFRVDKEFYFGKAPVAIDIGLIMMLSYGAASVDVVDVDAQQVDVMEGLTLGLKFSVADRVWFGIGGMVGIDCRYLYADLGNSWWYDDQLDEFNYGLFYGAYATADFRFSSHFGMNIGVRYVATQVEFDDQLDGLEKDINYILFELGFTWAW